MKYTSKLPLSTFNHRHNLGQMTWLSISTLFKRTLYLLLLLFLSSKY